MAETTRGFRVGSVHESPKSLPSDMLRMLGLLHSLGLVVIAARSAERAHSCSAARRHRSRVAGCFILFAGLLPEQSDPRTRQPRVDRTQARVVICLFSPALAGCRGGAILGRLSPRGLDAGQAPLDTSSHRIFWFGRDIFSSRPAQRDRRRAQPPSRPAPFGPPQAWS